MRAGKRFPLLGLRGNAGSLPWDLIAPHEAQAMKNHDQTLERLAERGGLSYSEAAAVIYGEPWPGRELDEAPGRLLEAVERWAETGRTRRPTDTPPEEEDSPGGHPRGDGPDPVLS